MFYVLQNESTAARRRVPILLTDAATGTTAQTGVLTANIHPYVNINGGAFIGGSGTIGEAGFGQYYYEMEVNETSTLGLAGIHITASNCRDYDAITQIAALNVYSPSAGGGATAGDIWSYVLSNASSADANLVAAAAGGGVTAGDIWDYDLSAYIASTQAGALLNETYTKVNTNLDSAISNVPVNVWTTNLSLGYIAPDAGGYLYELGIGATGYPSGGGSGISAFDVWNYNLLSSGQSADATLGNADLQATDAATNTNSPTLEANVWSYATRTLTSAAGATAGDVWTYASRTITGGIADTVTTLTNKSGFAITGGTITTVLDKTGYSLSGTQSFNLTGNITGNLSGSVGSVSGNVGGNVVGSVASVTNPVSVTNGTYSAIASSVWNSLTASFTTNGTFGKTILRSDAANKAGDVTLYSTGGVNGVDADMHRIANDTAAATVLKEVLTGIGGSVTANIFGNVSGSVGSVTNPVSVATASMSGIANTVWLTNISGYTSGSAGYALNTAAGGGVALTAGDIWTYSIRTITGGIADTVTTATNATNVTNPVSVSTISMTGIANSTWSYGSRTLTSAAGATAGDIWSYDTRTLTSGAGITVIGAVQLVNGPYKLTSNQNNNDGVLDILQNSVQEINLNLIDGNGAPASTAGYGVVVNFFNEAGSAVTSYVPVIEYADGGILTFEIDTAVTATTGRYNLIVNLSGAGFLVKYGPLTTLVRPL